MLSRSLSASFSSGCRRERALAGLLAYLALTPQTGASAALEPTSADIRLELSPRICTLGVKDQQCEARVQATWHSPTEESLCLVIEGRPEVKQCWENYVAGTYTIELVFNDDLLFELKDLELQRVLAAETLRVIREAIHYRHKRRQPWNVFD